MSMPPDELDDLELQALQRQLDDAFETTRPRATFEDELWLRVQSSRPVPSRLRDALSGFWEGVRAVPAVPAAAVAAVLVVAIGVGLVAVNGGLGRTGGGASTALSTNREAPAAGQYLAGNFGRVPSPVFNNSKGGGAPLPSSAVPNGADYAGPVQLTWSGTFDLTITTAPVFRYREPSTNEADQFATGLGAVLRGRPSGFLGAYSASDYTLKVRGTVQSPPSSPAYFIFASLSMPPIQAAGAGPQDVADIFLAQHSLQPQWNYAVSVDTSSDPVRVVYQRSFNVSGYGAAYMVDFNSNRYGLEVDLSSDRPVLATGTLPVGLDIADYRIISAGDAIRAATGFSSSSTDAAVPVAQLNHAELVYVLVPAGDHSFYEPAFLFTGAVKAGGQAYTKHVLVAAVDPSQRS